MKDMVDLDESSTKVNPSDALKEQSLSGSAVPTEKVAPLRITSSAPVQYSTLAASSDVTKAGVLGNLRVLPNQSLADAAAAAARTIPTMLPFTLQQQVAAQRAALAAGPLLNPKGIGSFTHGLGGVHHHNTVAEFLYQLTKMLTDDNKDIIEWVNGRIEVHDPPKLEEEVLHKYFRHSKYASFQRQLNYFGFRKLAGKGKMSPCSYVNDDTTNDLRSLLSIKRKTSASRAADRAAAKKRDDSGRAKEMLNHIHQAPKVTSTVHPAFGFINETNKRIRLESGVVASNSNIASNTSLAEKVNYKIGRGITHSMMSVPLKDELKTKPAASPQAPLSSATSTNSLIGLPSFASMSNLLELPGMTRSASSASLDNESAPGVVSFSTSTTSLAEALTEQSDVTSDKQSIANNSSHNSGPAWKAMSRESSLVDLAMLPMVDTPQEMNSTSMGFIDFPQGFISSDNDRS